MIQIPTFSRHISSFVVLITPYYLAAQNTLTEIGNDQLSVTFSSRGAELQHVQHVPSETEYLWQGDPQYWDARSPNMFPVNVRFKDDTYTYKGIDYEMPTVGFANTSQFKTTEHSKDQARFSFESSEKTLKHYPFPFRYEILARVSGLSLEQIYTVTNTGSETMYFAMAAHPGIRIPFIHGRDRSDYEICFSHNITTIRHEVSEGLTTGKQIDFLKKDARLNLLDPRVPNGGMLIKKMESREIGIALKDQAPYATIHLGNFPNTNMWSPHGVPYVCIEPMLGTHDAADSDRAMEKKPYLIQIEPGMSRTYHYTLTIHPEEGTKALN